MTIQQLIARIREIGDEESEIVGRGCELRRYLRERNPETVTFASRLLDSLIPEINVECRRLRQFILKLQQMDGSEMSSEDIQRSLAQAEARLDKYRQSFACAEQNKHNH